MENSSRFKAFDLFQGIRRLTTIGFAAKRLQDFVEKMAFEGIEPDKVSLENLEDRYEQIIDETIATAIDLRNEINDKKK